MKTYTKSLLSLSIATALAVSTQASAFAQEATAEEEQVEVIAVTGFRGSLIKARDLKRNAIGSQDSIVAEDIADFPDLNLADSLQRIPGISITREGGEGRQISLRGMGSDFTRVQLNGMEVLGNTSSAMDSRGSISRTRAFDFNIFAAELFNQIDVKKSYSADLDEGGIGGTVNLRTARPFDYDGFKGAITGNIGTNSNTDSTDPRVAFMVSNIWDNFGALFSVAYNKRDTAETGVDTFRWRQRNRSNWTANNIELSDGNGGTTEVIDSYTFNGNSYNSNLDLGIRQSLEGLELDPVTGAPIITNRGTASASTVATDPSSDIWFARGNRYSSWTNEQERIGITSAFQYRPTENLSFNLDLLFGQLKHDRIEYHLDTNGSSSTALGYIEALTVIDNNGDLEAVNGTFTDLTLRTETRKDRATTDFQQIALSSDWTVSDNLTMRGLLGYEKSEFKQPQRDKVYFQTTGGITTDYETDRFYGNFSYDFDPADIDNWTVRELDFQEDESITEFLNAELNFEYYLENGNEIRFGVSVKNFENSGFRFQANDLVKDLGAPAFGNQEGDAPDIIQPDGYSIFNHPNANWVAADVDAVQAYYGVSDWDITDPSVAEFYSTSSSTGDFQTRPQNRFGIEEDTIAFYAQYMFEFEDLGIRGSVGARYFSTDITSSGVTNDTGEAFSVEQDYDDILPTFNIVGDINDESLWRLSISKNITRPSLADLSVTAPQIQNDPDGSAGLRVSSGNPALQPFESLNADASYEYYFDDNVGTIAVGLFYKDIENFIVSETINVPYGELGLPTEFLGDGQDENTIYQFATRVNGNDTTIKGVELAIQRDFDFLPAPFDKLGVVANYTYADGEILYENVQGDVDQVKSFPGLSKNSYNFTLYYETEEYGARVAVANRGQYIQFVEAGLQDEDERGFHETTHVDFSAFYQLSENLKITFEGVNLTNEREEQYSDSSDRSYNTTTSGRSYYVGGTYTF